MKIKHLIPLLVLAGYCTVSAQTTNAPSNTDSTNTMLIVMEDVPITRAIESLARQADIDYALDPKVGYGQPDKNGQIKSEPGITVYCKNVTARQTLVAVLDNFGLQLVENPPTGAALITEKPPATENVVVQSVSLPVSTNDVTKPVILFEGVTISTDIVSLAHLAEVNCVFDPKVMQFKSDTPEKILWPGVSNVTARQALVCFLDVFGLQLIYDPKTTISRITKKHPIVP
jgi:hypothetical protein